MQLRKKLWAACEVRTCTVMAIRLHVEEIPLGNDTSSQNATFVSRRLICCSVSSASRQHCNGKICYGAVFFFFLCGVPAASSRVATAAPPPCPSRSTVSPQNGIFRYGRCRHYKAYFKTTDACACHMSGPRINETGRHTMSNTLTRRTRNKVTIYWRHEALPDRTAHAGTKQLGSPTYLDEQGLRNALKRAHR